MTRFISTYFMLGCFFITVPAMLAQAADSVDEERYGNGKHGLVMGALTNFKKDILYLKIDTPVVQEYSISGFAHGYKDSSWLYLDEAGRLGIAIDSGMVINERFSFRVYKPSSEKLKRYAIRTKSYSDYKIFWMEDHSIIFSAQKGNFRKALINGSVMEQQHELFERLTMPLDVEIDSLHRNFGNTDSVIWQNIIRLETERKEKSIRFVEANASYDISAYLLSVYCKQWGKEISVDLYNRLSASSKQSEFGQKVKSFIDLNRQVEVGSSYVDFELPSPEGKPLRLSSLKGKYILLEFWASWCGPCRKENPNLVALYKKYKSRGFEIFGVSHDIGVAEWKKAIAKDQLTWSNVSALKGNEYGVDLMYGIYELPTNFLIDPDGKIIAKNLRGEFLNKKLQQLFGE